MDYTQSNSYDTHAGTGHRMHEDAKAIPTVWSANDANSLIWSAMEVIQAAGLAPKQFNKGDPNTYRVLLQAIRMMVGTQNQVSFLTSGTWLVPANVYRIRARVWGAGGGGGGTSNGAAAGGAGGGYAEGLFAVTPGSSIPVTIGSGGAAGTGTPTAGGTGGTSSVGTLIGATGGGGGSGAGAGGVAPVTSLVGEGYGGQINLRGSPANAGITLNSIPLGSAGGGAFSTSIVGGFSNAGGNGAGFPGGGGGGAGGTTYAAGNTGAAGLVIIEW